MTHDRTSRVLGAVAALTLVLGTLAIAGSALAEGSSQPGRLRLDTRGFSIVRSRSGSTNYYSLLDAGEGPFIRSLYEPDMSTAVMGIEIPDAWRKGVNKVKWRWRIQVLPTGGNECDPHKSDSGAVVYVTFKRTLRWYSLKYVWSAAAPVGVTCDRSRGTFSVQDTIIQRSDGPPREWQTEEIDPTAEYRRHFADGNPNADVPDLVGIGIMSDGDQTHSVSSADFADFELERN